jgi:hypothetical protein
MIAWNGEAVRLGPTSPLSLEFGVRPERLTAYFRSVIFWVDVNGADSKRTK